MLECSWSMERHTSWEGGGRGREGGREEGKEGGRKREGGKEGGREEEGGREGRREGGREGNKNDDSHSISTLDVSAVQYSTFTCICSAPNTVPLHMHWLR